MCYLRDLVYKPEAKPASYWRNTSDNSIIRSFIDYAGSSITNKLETLMDGGYIIQKIDENLTYDYLHSSEDNLWSMLYLTGYLTQKKGIEYQSEFYHAFLSGIFTGAGYQVQSNKEHGEGRSDIVVCDSLNGRVAIFEAKRITLLKNLETECDKALRQIDERMYAKDFEDAYDQVLCYGIAFFKKRCMVKRKES